MLTETRIWAEAIIGGISLLCSILPLHWYVTYRRQEHDDNQNGDMVTLAGFTLIAVGIIAFLAFFAVGTVQN